MIFTCGENLEFRRGTPKKPSTKIQTLDAELSYIKRKFPDHIDPTISTRDFIDFDIEVSTSHGLLTTAGIIAEITGTQDEELEDEDDKDEDKLTAKQVRSAIAVLEDLSIFSKFKKEMMASLKDLNLNIKRDYDIACKQKVITDFFSM